MMPCENICSTAPLRPMRVQRHQPEQHEAHVADARIADDEFEILLHQRHHRAIDDADDRQQRDHVAP